VVVTSATTLGSAPEVSTHRPDAVEPDVNMEMASKLAGSREKQTTVDMQVSNTSRFQNIFRSPIPLFRFRLLSQLQ